MDWLKDKFFGNQAEKKGDKPVSTQPQLITRLLLLAMAGILLLGVGRIFSNAPNNQKTTQNVFNVNNSQKLSAVQKKIKKESTGSIESYETYASQSLENILDQMQGVSDASVMITFSSTEKAIYQNNIQTQDNQTVESDQKGGTRQVNERDQNTQVVMVEKNGSKEPVVIGKQQPTVRGVIVVVRGADQPATRAEIMDAVATVLDIPNYKVKVLPKE